MGKIATREAYGKALAKLVVEQDDVVVLDADLSKSTKTADAKKARPDRHFNMGIAEGNMMAVAAGLAASGKTVFASSFSIFATGRAFEQVRNSICYPHLNVKVCGTHAGITVGEDGASHQSVEDMACMSAIPGMTVICPADGIETEQAIYAVYEHDGPCYVRLGRSAVEDVHPEGYEFEIGKGVVLREGKDIALVACGVMVQESLKAAKMLEEHGLNVTVVNMATIKPVDVELLVELAKTHKTIYTLEEHNVIGGLGSMVCQTLAQTVPTKCVCIGMLDSFGESGKPDQLMDKYGLSAEKVVERILATK
ncbi:MAG: transketolase family protein [Erysipelotrichaceae bacterium]|nr:transketolase family protein [Erysipelotrichaceae bacterium]